MRRNRVHWLLAAGIIATAVLGARGAVAGFRRDSADAAGPLDLARVGVEQVRRDLEIKVRTHGAFDLRALDPRPDLSNPNDRFLCLRIHRSGGSLVRVLCFGTPPSGTREVLGYGRLAPDGSLRSWQRIDARVRRPSRFAVEARIRPAAADLRPHRYRWRMVSQWSGPLCQPSSPKRFRRSGSRGRKSTKTEIPCLDRAPDGREARLRIFKVQPVGCTQPGPRLRFAGPSRRKRVALTFDDGPSSYTPKVLRVLKRKHAKGTFFEIGENVPAYASFSREVLASGNELGNHTQHHESHPSASSMAAANRRINRTTGFEPCLFRPPDGAVDSRVVRDADRLGMTTIIWNVDPRDWSTPGAGAIYSRVVSATRPGSIVVMHDGGGNRSQTVAALPRIISTLRHRGYSFVTVTKLLHGHMIWGPAR